MNYTYYEDGDNQFIIISTPKDTTKYQNITKNNKVSMLIHDWISDKKEENGRRNSLFELITNLNKNELNSVSVMLNGECKILDDKDERFQFFKNLHLNNSNIDNKQLDNYANDDSALIVITISNCKITDINDNIQEY